MFHTMNISAAATRNCIDQNDHHVLIREVDGKVMIRPTYRRVNKYTPEQARKISFKNSGSKISFTSDLVKRGSRYILVPMKYGWFELNEVTDYKISDNYVSISA